MQQTKIMMGSLGDMGTVNLDRASEVKLKIVENGEDINDFKGIYNVSQGRLANVVSKNYQIIQHDDVVQSVRDTLGRLNIEVKGKMGFYKDTMDIRLVFKDRDDLIIKDDTNEGIMLGMRILNSYDKKTAFRLEMFGVRMFCDNGMVLGKAINDVRSVTVHLGETKTRDVIAGTVERFVAEMINSSQKLQRYVSECMVDSIEWDMAQKLLGALVQTEKHRKALIERIGMQRSNITKWEIYNAITDYATHNEQLTPHVESYLQNIAQDVLTISSEKLIKDRVIMVQNENS